MAEWIQIVCFSAAIAGSAFSGVALLLLFRARAKHSRLGRPTGDLPPVSIFKPLKGADESLESNLATFFRIDYPSYELIFGVSDSDDPAVPIVERLIRRFPEVPARLVINSHRTGHNPKVNNLCNLAPSARYDYWLISDSNVAVPANYLSDLIAYMQQPGVGMVTSLIRGIGGDTLGARLENLHLNGFIAGSTLAVSQLSHIPVSIGKSMLLRRETMIRLGGFAAFADYLLEDGLIGREVRKLGYLTRTTFNAVDNVNHGWPLASFISRHRRWAVMRRQLNFWHYCAELVSNPILLSSLAVAVNPTPTSVLVGTTIWMLRVLLDLITIRLVGGNANLVSALLLPVKDLIIGGLWPIPLFTNRVRWRGNLLCVGKMTRVILLDQSTQAAPRGTAAAKPWRRFSARPLLYRTLRYVLAEERR